ESFGGGRKYRELSAHPIVLISHHALSRAAQRLKLREIEAIPVIAESILDAAVNLLLEKKTLAAWLAAPPQGWRVTIAEDDSAVVVLKRHETVNALVATTVFEASGPEVKDGAA